MFWERRLHQLARDVVAASMASYREGWGSFKVELLSNVDTYNPYHPYWKALMSNPSTCRQLFVGCFLMVSAHVAAAADVWLATSSCTRLPNTTVQAEFDTLRSRWGDHLEILAEPHKSRSATFFSVVGHAKDGTLYPFMVSDSEAMCRKAVQQDGPPPRPVKGWGDDPGWQWSDAFVRKYAKAWRSVNLGGPVDCTLLGQGGAMDVERAFVGQVAHIQVQGVPAVFMVRDHVQVYLMPVDAAGCRSFASTLPPEASR